MNQPKTFGKLLDLGIVLLAIMVIPWLSARLADLIYPAIAHLDPDETFIWITIHHIFQLVLTVGLMFLLGGKQLDKWGFNLKNLGQSMQWILIFGVVWTIMEYLRVSRMEMSNLVPEYALNATNVWGIQGFQYLLSGLGEEPLFRGFVITFLSTQWQKVFKPFGIEVSVPVLISIVLFMLAHVAVDFSGSPMFVFDFDQQMKALQLGLLYGICFHYTKSLLAPIVIHGLSNGVMFTLMFFALG